MKKLFLFLAMLLLVFACGSEDKSTDTVTNDTLKNDTNEKEEVAEETKEEYPDIVVYDDTKEDITQEEIKIIDVGGKDEQSEKFGSCNDLYFKCIIACGNDDTDCENACLDKALNDDIKTAFTEMKGCLSDNCADKESTYDKLVCLKDNCIDKFNACLFGDGKCDSINGCANSCSVDDIMCYYHCLSKGDKDAQQAFIAFYTCLEEVCSGKTGNDYEQCKTAASGNECLIQFNNCIGTM